MNIIHCSHFEDKNYLVVKNISMDNNYIVCSWVSLPAKRLNFFSSEPNIKERN